MSDLNDRPSKKSMNRGDLIFGVLAGVLCLSGLILGSFSFYLTVQTRTDPILFEQPHTAQPAQGQVQKEEEGGFSLFSPARPFGPVSPAPGSGNGF